MFGVIDVRVLDYPDKPFIAYSHPIAVDEVAETIREVRPHILIAQSPYMTEHQGRVPAHPNDHTEVGVVAMMAKASAAAPKLGASRPPHKIALTLFMGIYFNQDEWDFTIDVNDWYEQRVQAEALFESQGHTLDFARKRIEIGVGRAGWAAGTGYAEAFVRERFARLTRIPVSEIELRASLETEKEMLSRLTGKS